MVLIVAVQADHNIAAAAWPLSLAQGNEAMISEGYVYRAAGRLLTQHGEEALNEASRLIVRRSTKGMRSVRC